MAQPSPAGFLSIVPYEIAFAILALLRPSDLFRLKRASKSFYTFITENDAQIARAVAQWRYSFLMKSFPAPVPSRTVPSIYHDALRHPTHRDRIARHLMIYQQIGRPDYTEVCPCTMCIFRWIYLAVAVDFAYWQNRMDNGQPIPVVPRRDLNMPDWNKRLADAHAIIVNKAVGSPLWYACILQAHLDSTTRSIRRLTANRQGYSHQKYRDLEPVTDAFLDPEGPLLKSRRRPVPANRDQYYHLLDTFMLTPGFVGWSVARSSRYCWVYNGTHDASLEELLKGKMKQRRHRKIRRIAAAVFPRPEDTATTENGAHN